jgi:hypothetical protein
MKALLLLACLAHAAGTVKTTYAPVPKAWTAPMVSFLSSPGFALLNPSPINARLLSLRESPQALQLALAPVAEFLRAEVFAGLTPQGQAAALAEALPLAARSVKLKAHALHAQALKAQTQAEVSEAAEGLRQLEQHFGAYAEAAGLSFKKLQDMRRAASRRVAELNEVRMEKELGALQRAFEANGMEAADLRLYALVDAAQGDSSLFFETAVSLFAEFEKASDERRLTILAALSRMAANAHPADRAVLSGRLGALMAGVTDHRVLTAGHLLAAKLSVQGIRRGKVKVDLEKYTGGERHYGALEGFVPVIAVQDKLSLPRTDDGRRYGFARAKGSRLTEEVPHMRLAVIVGGLTGTLMSFLFSGGFDIWATLFCALGSAVLASLMHGARRLLARRRALTP